MLQSEHRQTGTADWGEHRNGHDKSVVRPLLAIIEDNDDSREALQEALVDSGYRVLAFENANRALDLLERGEIPELIVLDLMMPGMDGWTFRLEQKKRPTLREIPVIAVSGDSSAKAAAMDVAAYLRKPIDLDRLTLLIEQVLATSARKQLMLKGVELERLRSLGMLVASIAHEVNNPLAGVVGYLDVCSRYCQRARGTDQLDEGLADKFQDAIDSAQDGTQRIASIVRLLLTFARSEDDAPNTADAARALDAALSLAMPQIRHRAQVIRRGETKPMPLVRINEARLAQVFLNLLINAMHSMDRRPTEDNRIEVSVSSDEACVAVEITDTGSGIPPEILSRIFEPFFSTKQAGHGTGLGLSISREVIQSVGGTIRVHSQVGKGSTFRVEIPVAVAEPEEKRASVRPEPASDGQDEALRIVIVDDEPLMGQMLSAMLDEHHVEVYRQPELALSALEKGNADLILCDFLMPTMTGDVFFRHLTGIRPDLANRFVLMTGASPSQTLDKLMGEMKQPILKKPFTERALQACLAQVQQRKLAAPQLV